MDYSHPELVDRLAAGYVNGTLRGPARRRLEVLLPAHPALRDAVADWQERLLPMTLSIPPRQPPAAVWQRIERQLYGQPEAMPRWWQRLAFWRYASATGLGLSLALAVWVATPTPSQAPFVVVLNAVPGTETGLSPASFVASISADGRAMVTRPLVQVALQADKSLELWALPVEGPPRSLGVISEKGASVVRRDQLLQGTDALAVTLEPPGGSPDGRPTGAVVYMGKLNL
jgi:anti-sigma-K factor RskA